MKLVFVFKQWCLIFLVGYTGDIACTVVGLGHECPTWSFRDMTEAICAGTDVTVPDAIEGFLGFL